MNVISCDSRDLKEWNVRRSECGEWMCIWYPTCQVLDNEGKILIKSIGNILNHYFTTN